MNVFQRLVRSGLWIASACLLMLMVSFQAPAVAGQTGVIMSVSTNDGDVVFAQPTADGKGWIKVKTVNGWRVSGFHPRGGHFDHYWAQFVPLPPGRYGIVSVHWVQAVGHFIAATDIIQGGDGVAIYREPIVEFTIRPNEVVNAGFFALYLGRIAELPDDVWQEFKAAHPDLAAVAVKRTMVRH